MTHQPHLHRTWRLALSWHGTVLDVVTLGAARAVLRLRTGEVLEAQVIGDVVRICGNGIAMTDVLDGHPLELPAGHTLMATRAYASPRASTLYRVDSIWLHAAMLGVTLQTCVVAVLMLMPASSLDGDPAGGLPSDWRRTLSVAGGTASSRGVASIRAVGRPLFEAERPELHTPERRQAQLVDSRSGMAAEKALEITAQMLAQPDDVPSFKDAIGDAALKAAHAPVLGAGVGGLSPRDPLDTGITTGPVGMGTSRLTDTLRTRDEELERRAASALQPQASERAPPTLVLEEDQGRAGGAVTTIDPVIKAHLLEQVRQRHNVIRGCYEARGLGADARLSGRLVLNMTLQPDGSVDEAKASVDTPALHPVAVCVERLVEDWYLGGGLVDASQRLAFPFVLRPHVGP